MRSWPPVGKAMFSVSGFNEEGGRKDIKVKKYLEEGLLLLVAT